jgi:voltage-gated potassium channel Kch
MVSLLLSGTAFFSFFESWSIIDSLYFCVMTIATIGYGDLAPSSNLSKVFTIIMALGGIGVFVGIVTKLAQSLTQKGIERRHNHNVKNN